MADESFIHIDKYRLDEEWLNQPVLYLQYAGALAEAEADEGEAKAEMELVRAEVAAAIRDSPNNFGLKRVSNDAVDGVVLTTSEFQAAQKEYLACKRKVGNLKAAVRALEHRKTALENEVYLHGQGYFAEKPKSRLSGMGGRDAIKDARRRVIRKPLSRADDDD
jgi:flagellar motility protein MotE (MotC chaperone)